MKGTKLKLPKPLKLGKSSAYDPPPEKFVVVVHPWMDLPSPDSENSTQKFCNTIGAWFECMLKSTHGHSIRIKTVFHLYKQRQYVIVELPADVNVELILGTHRLEEFANRPVNKKSITYIYEYDYRRFGDPDRILKFNSVFPTYSWKDIDRLPVKQDDYPSPDVPSRPSALRDYYALPISEEVQAHIAGRRAACMVSQRSSSAEAPIHHASSSGSSDSHERKPEASASTSTNGVDPSVAFTPYVPPSHLYPRPGGGIVDTRGSTQPPDSCSSKRDPFEGEEDTKANLHNRSDSSSGASIKLEPGGGVKREPGVKLEPGLHLKQEPGVKVELGLKSEPDLSGDIPQEAQDLYSEYSDFRRQQQSGSVASRASCSETDQRSISSRVKAEPMAHPQDSRTTGIKPEVSEPEQASSAEMQALYDEWKAKQNADSNQSRRPSSPSLSSPVPQAAPPAWKRPRERNVDLVFASKSSSESGVKAEYTDGLERVRANGSGGVDMRSIPGQYGVPSLNRPVKREFEDRDRHPTSAPASTNHRSRSNIRDESSSNSRRSDQRYSSRDSEDVGRRYASSTEGIKHAREVDDRHGRTGDDGYHKRFKREY